MQMYDVFRFSVLANILLQNASHVDIHQNKIRTTGRPQVWLKQRQITLLVEEADPASFATHERYIKTIRPITSK